jgi:anthranilate 1,2-dioxygenase large subunit/terephthalate 1,2-dioxygenase oxygenase component alpha subunit
VPDDAVAFTWPPEGLTRVPYQVFDDPEIYAREQIAIFRGPTWNYLAVDCEIPNEGDYKLTQVGDTPVIVCRDDEGDARAFVNRCAHRGALLCFNPTGHCERFTCVYHNWSYDLTGRLTGVPFRHGVRGEGGMPESFDVAAHGLEALRTTTRGGVIFGTFSPQTPPLTEYLGPTMVHYMDRLFNRPILVLGRYSQLLRNNWKLVMENVRDPYHASILHLFFGSLGLNRQTMRGEALADERGWHHISYAARATDDIRGSEYDGKLPSMRTDVSLADPSLLDGWPEFGDGITNLVQTTFPTLCFHQISNCLGIRHLVPRGPDRSELFWTLFGYRDDGPSATRIRVKHANLIGPAGFVSLEDGAVTHFVQRGIRGRFNGAASVVELGGSSVGPSATRATEAPIRGFWKGWRDMMGI